MTGRDIAKITFNLVIVYLAGGLILAAVYAKTSPIMYRNALLEKETALKKLMPDADKIEKAGDWSVHEKHAEYFISREKETGLSVISCSLTARDIQAI